MRYFLLFLFMFRVFGPQFPPRFVGLKQEVKCCLIDFAAGDTWGLFCRAELLTFSQIHSVEWNNHVTIGVQSTGLFFMLWKNRKSHLYYCEKRSEYHPSSMDFEKRVFLFVKTNSVRQLNDVHSLGVCALWGGGYMNCIGIDSRCAFLELKMIAVDKVVLHACQTQAAVSDEGRFKGSSSQGLWLSQGVPFH